MGSGNRVREDLTVSSSTFPSTPDRDKPRLRTLEYDIAPASPPGSQVVSESGGFVIALAIWRLLTTGSTRAPAVALLVVFIMLTAYTTVLAIRPPDEPAGCGCGLSRAVVEHWWPLAVRNGVAAVILVACALGVRAPGAESPAPGHAPASA